MAGYPPPAQVQSFMEHSGSQSQGMEAVKMENLHNETATMITLLVRHLPEGIPHHTLSRLFSHYGAHSVRPCAAGRLRNCAFIDFKSDAAAYQAQRQLNGLRFLGKVLTVEKANNRGKQSEDQGRKDNVVPISRAEDAHSTGREFTLNSKSGPYLGSEPIAPKLGVDYPFPPHLEYAYPPPDGNILTNIVNALIAVPRFYTQVVLHLMNKMNIPAPFRMALPTPPLPPSESAPAPPQPPPVESNRQSADASSSESELETSEEDVDDKVAALGTTVNSSRKRKRREAIVGPAVDKKVAHEAVGLKLASLLPKEIPVVKKRNTMLQIKIVPKEVQKENKDSGIEAESVEPELQTPSDKAFATPEDIQSNKLAPEEILSLPKFKNYTIGNPATVLYIKNLSKDVVPDDFSYVFGSLFGSPEAAKAGLTVKLMQEGRMRGQAFVTFPSVELAHQALNLVNGYMFKGKPMIVQFGRNPSAARQDEVA
ncbi:U11/U12 small nuclear ribonucleoprotein 65 kDa protein [Linum perenne]